jgi:hypothetical protein
MSVLRIKWAGYCPKCDSDELDVHTEKGTPNSFTLVTVLFAPSAEKKAR